MAVGAAAEYPRKPPRGLFAFGFAALATATAVAGSALGAAGGLARGIVGAAALTAVAVGAHRNAMGVRWGWALLGAGIGLWALGDGVWDWITWRSSENPATLYTADALYLAGYPLLAAGLVAMVRARNPRGSRDGLLDGAILAVAAVILVWVFLVAPQGRGTELALADRLILGAYPLGDGLLLAGVAWLALSPGRRGAALWLLTGALGLNFGADLAWNLAARLGETDAWTPWLNPWWTVSYALIGAAALHPSARDLTETLPPPDAPTHPARLAFLGVALFVGPVVTVLGDGQIGGLDVMVTGCSFAVAALVVGRFLGLVHDHERARAAAAASERRFRVITDASPVGIHEVTPELMITYANEESAHLFGGRVDGQRADELIALVDPRDRDRITDAVVAVVEGRRATAEFRLGAGARLRWVAWHGAPVLDDDAHVTAIFASLLDITPLKQAEEMLERQATHDPLTGLPNRRLLLDRLGSALRELPRRGGIVGVLFLDLDRFKLVNDLLGHDVGDALLVEIARRIRVTVRARDTAARFGGDEFVIVLDDACSPDELTATAARLVAAVERPVRLDNSNSDIDVGASIGIAVADGPDDPDALLRDADAAMYRAKQAGRGRFEVFDGSRERDAGH
jgi:diguanylate cyclase (GGDEF)-like protein/PAS domain S-box-containing protein